MEAPLLPLLVLTKTALSLPYHCLQPSGHYLGLISERVHWEGGSTHAPSTYKGTFVSGSLRGWHAPRVCLTPRTPRNRQERQLSGTHNGGGCGRERAQSPELLTWFIPNWHNAERKTSGNGQIMSRKISCKQLTGKLTWKARTKNTQAIGS